MEIKFEDITDQQCVDIIAHFFKSKGADKIIIHAKSDDIVVTKKPRLETVDDGGGFACTAACALMATIS